ncbi:hypothetical protein TNCV_2831141 [Trichonephila clavipes]|nr:hypothetical protein TNCV_2831141 [Trichonephila clavipes]
MPQLNDKASHTVSKWTVQRSLHRMGFRIDRPTRVPLLNAHHRELRIWRQAHEAMDPACQVETVQEQDSSIMVYGVFSSNGCEVLCTNLPQFNSVRRVARSSPQSIYVVLLFAE